jgi:hypothetical protein
VSFGDRMEDAGWVRARTSGGCPACGATQQAGDPPGDKDKCWLAPEEHVQGKNGKVYVRPAAWKVLCAGQYTLGGGAAADADYVFDPGRQPEGDFNRQYILKSELEKIQAGQAASGSGGKTVRRRRLAAGPQQAVVNKLERGTPVARPGEGDQADRAAFARGLWERAVDADLVDAYLRARGRNAEAVRGMGPQLRYLRDCPFGEDDEQGGRVTRKLPAVVMPVTNAAGEVVGVHRIAIEPDGSGKSGQIVNAKQLLGSPLPGTWIDIPGDDRGNGGIAVACEGPETGWAIAEATGFRVLVCISTSGLWTLELPAEMVGEGDGQIGTLVIAADADAEAWRAVVEADGDRRGTEAVGRDDPRWRSADARQVGMSGQRVARATARKLRGEYPGLRVGVAFPRARGVVRFDEHARVRPEAEPGEWVPVDLDAKSVDFEDIANGDRTEKGIGLGLKRVEKLIGQAARQAVAVRSEPDEPELVGGGGELPPLDIRRAASGDGDGPEGERVMPRLKRHTAMWFVSECFPSGEPARANGAAFALVWLRQRWWKHDGRVWVQITDEELRGTLERWLETLGMYKTVGRGDKAEEKWFQVVPNTKLINELLDTLRTEMHVPADQLPGYLQPTYAADGEPLGYDDAHNARMLTRDQARAEALPDLKRSVMFANGTMPIESLLAGEPEVVPHTERLLSMSGIPVDWPREATMAIRRGDIEGWLRDSCPNFIAHLQHVESLNRGAHDAIVRHHGASIGMLSGDQTALWIHGESGSGKSTLLNVLMTHHGDAAMTGIRLSQLVQQDYLIGLEGKRAALVGEMESGGISQLQVAEILKTAIRNEELRARELYQNVIEFKPFARWWLVSNRLFKMRDPGDALAKSIVFVEFPEGVRGTETQSEDYGRRIMAEARASMVYCVWHGLRQYVLARQEGKRPIRPPARHAESADVFGMQSNVMGRFVEDHIEYCDVPVDMMGRSGADAQGKTQVPWLSVQAIHEAFCAYTNEKPGEASKRPEQLSPEFKALRSRSRHQRDKRPGGKFGDGRVAVYHGVRFRDGSIEELWPTDGKPAPIAGYGSASSSAGPQGPRWPYMSL